MYEEKKVGKIRFFDAVRCNDRDDGVATYFLRSTSSILGCCFVPETFISKVGGKYTFYRYRRNKYERFGTNCA